MGSGSPCSGSTRYRPGASGTWKPAVVAGHGLGHDFALGDALDADDGRIWLGILPLLARADHGAEWSDAHFAFDAAVEDGVIATAESRR